MSMRFLKKKRSKLSKGRHSKKTKKDNNNDNNKIIFQQQEEGQASSPPFFDSTDCTTSLTDSFTIAAVDEFAVVAVGGAVPSSPPPTTTTSNGSVAGSSYCTTQTKKKKNIATRLFHKVSPLRRREKKRIKKMQRRIFFRDAINSSVPSSADGENQCNNPSNNVTFLDMSPLRTLRDLERHYFWGSSPLLQIYAVIIAAIFIRQVWVLHGLYLVFVLQMALLAIKWLQYVVEGKEFSDICRLIMWAVNRFSDEADRALHGDGLRIWLAGASLHGWNKIGKGYVYHLLRDQCRTTNAAMIRESKDKLERNESTLRKLLMMRRNIADEIIKRREDLMQFGSDVKSRGIEFRENMVDAMAERRIELRCNVQLVQDTVQDKVARLTTTPTLKSKGKG